MAIYWATTDTQAARSPDLLARIAHLEGSLQAALRRIEQLEAAAPLDAPDVALRRQLPISTRSLLFRAAHLLEHSVIAEDAELRHALLAADVTRVSDLGVWLRQHRGVRDGIVIERIGRRWRARHIEHMTCSLDPA